MKAAVLYAARATQQARRAGVDAAVFKRGPIKVAVDAGKDYFYCTCGLTKNQPFCDGSHNAVNAAAGSAFKPQRVTPDAAGDAFFCGCRRSRKGAFCDGTHRTLPEDGAASPTPPAADTSAAEPLALRRGVKVARRGPIFADVVAGKEVSYCTCGYSHNQPFCDGAHRAVNEELGTDFKPARYTPEESGTAPFCGCRHSASGMMCDGSHNALPGGAAGRSLGPTEYLAYSVLRSTPGSHDAQLITLKGPGPGEAMGVSYHFSARVGGKSRAYTPVKYSPETGEVDLLVKRVADGRVSPAITSLRPGDSLELRGPSPGEFHWGVGGGVAGGSPLLLLAAGSGVTPVFQILRDAVAGGAGVGGVPAIHVVFSNKTAADVLLREELLAARRDHPEVVRSVTFCVERGGLPDEQRGDAAVHEGFQDSGLLSGLLGQCGGATVAPTARAVICGPPGFNKASVEQCKALGIPEASITVC